MASFKCTGLDELCAAFSKAEKIPDTVVNDMLTGMGNILLSAVRATQMAGMAGASVLSSLVLSRPRKIYNGAKISVSFSGTRSDAKHKPGKTREAEIAFLNEFGVPGKQHSRPFIKDAIERSGDEVVAHGQNKFNDWLAKSGL